MAKNLDDWTYEKVHRGRVRQREFFEQLDHVTSSDQCQYLSNHVPKNIWINLKKYIYIYMHKLYMFWFWFLTISWPWKKMKAWNHQLHWLAVIHQCYSKASLPWPKNSQLTKGGVSLQFFSHWHWYTSSIKYC